MKLIVYDTFFPKLNNKSIYLLYKFTCTFIVNKPFCQLTFLQGLVEKWQRYSDLTKLMKLFPLSMGTCAGVEDDHEDQELNLEVTELSTHSVWIVISLLMQFGFLWEGNKHWFRMLSRCQRLSVLTFRFISQMFIFHLVKCLIFITHNITILWLVKLLKYKHVIYKD